MFETIEFSDFLKVELRVGRVVEASSPEWSEKLLEFKVDFGEEIGEGVSQGMMLMADGQEKPVVLELPEDLAPGTVLR
jgi:tRNA-binding EMAP/Myf-like protein